MCHLRRRRTEDPKNSTTKKKRGKNGRRIESIWHCWKRSISKNCNTDGLSNFHYQTHPLRHEIVRIRTIDVLKKYKNCAQHFHRGYQFEISGIECALQNINNFRYSNISTKVAENCSTLFLVNFCFLIIGVPEKN